MTKEEHEEGLHVVEPEPGAVQVDVEDSRLPAGAQVPQFDPPQRFPEKVHSTMHQSPLTSLSGLPQ